MLLRATFVAYIIFMFTVSLVAADSGRAARNSPDALDEALAEIGLRRADLGWEAKGWWPRWPEAPYKLRAFDALFAEPLDTVTYTRSLAQTAYDGLSPEALDADPVRGGRSLFRTVQRLGIDPLYGGFRGYTANNLASETPLADAILKLHNVANRTTAPNTFGMELPYPKLEDELRAAAAELPDDASKVLGQLVLNLIEARRWADLAFRKVDAADRMVVARRYDVGMEMIDAYDYCPQVDDVAKAWDQASLWYAAQKATDALDQARATLAQLDLAGVDPQLAFAWRSPWGWIRVHGAGVQDTTAVDEFLTIDLGGDDTYRGAFAGADHTRPLSLLLDLGGDDTYTAQQPAQGAGLTGVGILLDAGNGNDTYRAKHYAQGVGQFGLGLLVDFGGDDTYFVKNSGQGCGYFGAGLHFDIRGDDKYEIWADGQGLGGIAGVGVLADRDGDDHYTAVREHSITGRPSYHSPDLDVAVSNAQGVGMGRRGDGSDGHSYAGGLGALLDGGGNDKYHSGNWAMGTGYWFGIGVLHDRGGNDTYNGVAYTQATGAHFCIGVLIDEAGDDQHLAEENSHSSIAWAHDFTISVLLNVGGDDRYNVKTGGFAYSINRSIALQFDIGGDDRYLTDVAERLEKKHGLRFGYAANDERFRARGGVSDYFADTSSLALFMDIGGNDRYRGGSAMLSEEANEWRMMANDRSWTDPDDSPNWADRNFSIGVDRSDGSIDFTPAPRKRPTGPQRR